MKRHNPDDIFLALMWALLSSVFVLMGVVAAVQVRLAEERAEEEMNAAHAACVFLAGGRCL